MIKFGKWIAKHKVIIVIISMLLLIPSFLGMAATRVNYDILSYLPESLETVEGQDIMVDEFGMGAFSMVVVEDMELKDVAALKEKFQNVEHVKDVLWYDSVADLSIPVSMIPEKFKDGFFNGDATMMIALFDNTTSSDAAMEAVSDMRKIANEQCFISGMSGVVTDIKNLALEEMPIYVVIAACLSLLVLLLAMDSLVIPVLFLLSVGLAVVYNLGTNIFFGEVCYITKSLTAVLQLGVTMDYSIFLLDAFMSWRDTGLSEEEAIVKAVEEAINSIFASSLTTVVGFLALVTMKFNIGFDMGLVLAKGIVFSLLSVVFFMPAMILKFTKLNDRTKHRSFFPDFTKLGKGVFKIRYAVLIGVLLITPPAYVAQGMNHFLYGNSAVGGAKGTQVYEDDQEITARFGRSNMLLLIYPNNDMVAERRLSDELEDLPYVKSVTSMANTLPEGVPEEFLPESATSLLHKNDTARMLIYIRTKGESDIAFQCTDQIRDIMKKYYPEESYVVGETPSTQDIKVTITEDNTRVNVLSLLGVFMVVMFSFHSVLIPLVVMIPIEVAIFLNMAIPYIQGVDMVYMGYIIVSSIQLGATVDYSILLTNNYIAKRKLLPKKEACIEAVTRSCSSIFTSGTIITLAGYIVHFISTTAAIGDLGHLIGRGGLLSVMLVLTLLPALLVLCDPLIIEKDWKKPGRKIREHYGVRRHQFHERAERIRELGNRWKNERDV